ncbi:hypothetical protein KI387_032905 [Taxus chinensis]|uniref:NB-ARC domain-containing protein n=1 Tax=Taxus chinensis TaxID=29808 RepID=A0AA38F3Z5_TAXCH|nr:hypothetical protein KI387_032905 [Taxus chinensis]
MSISDSVQLFGGAGLGLLGNGVASFIEHMWNNGVSAVRMKKELEDMIGVLGDLEDSSIQECLSQNSRNKIEEFRKKLQDADHRIATNSPLSWESFTGSDMADLEDYVHNFSHKYGWMIVTEILGRLVEESREEKSNARGRGRGRDASSFQTLQLPKHQVGLYARVKELKDPLFKDDVKSVRVAAIGGSGKSTLVAALLRDSQVKARFVGGIIFETVSQNPSIKEILESMWKKISKSKEPKEFRNIDDARIQIEELLLERTQPTLMILDNVWSQNDLNQLLFEAPEYKTVVTTRCKLDSFDFCYDLPLLEEEDALSLFCLWAFGVDHIPETGCDKTLVQQVAAKCKGLPLAVQVVGTYLKNKSPAIWIEAESKLSKAEAVSDVHKAFLERMAISFTGPEDDVHRKCFLDLGLFPQEKKIYVDYLFDIWIHVHKLELDEAFRILRELGTRNLLDLVNDPSNHPGTSYGSFSEVYVVQHDVLRDLAIYLADNDKPVNKQKTMIMPRKEECIPRSWEKHSHQRFAAEIISIHTGSMNERQWPMMKFPKAQVLVLIITGNEYFLPPFLQTMAKLKVLIIISQTSIDTKLEGMSVLTSLAQLKSVLLERLTLPSFERYTQCLTNLKKFSLSLCKGVDIDVCSKFPSLEEISIDHCRDIKELPDSVCNLSSLKKVSITNCHDLNKLPEDLGKLAGSLVVLTLGASPALEALPDSVSELRKLKFLDISQCGCIHTFPNEFGKLQGLKVIDMRETCLKERKLPQSATELKSLSHVICDEKNEYLWRKVKESIPNLQVEIVKDIPDLKWLEIN